MGRTSHHSSAYLSNSNRITTYRQTFSYVCYAATKQWRHVDLSHPTDITKMKRQLLKQVHQQPAILYYDLKGSSQSFTNNYEQLDTTKMYLISKYRIDFKDDTYILKIYMSSTPLLKTLRKIVDNLHSLLIHMILFYIQMTTDSLSVKNINHTVWVYKRVFKTQFSSCASYYI